MLLYPEAGARAGGPEEVSKMPTDQQRRFPREAGGLESARVPRVKARRKDAPPLKDDK